MKALKVILGVILTLVIVSVALYAYYGGFAKIKFQVVEQGGEKLIYQDVKGNYDKCNDVINKMFFALERDYKIRSIRGFGIYYDNPLTVKVADLRSQAGCILENIDTTKILWLQDRYNIRTFPVKKYITTEFPYKGHTSVLISLLRVKPALNKYLKDNGYDADNVVMEIYDRSQKKLYYRVEMTLAKQ